jgi:hypothetical protein
MGLNSSFAAYSLYKYIIPKGIFYDILILSINMSPLTRLIDCFQNPVRDVMFIKTIQHKQLSNPVGMTYF